MHGELSSHLCQACGQRMAAEGDIDDESDCRLCNTSGQMRPDIVWFGEIPYHMERIAVELARCDLFIAVGTSGVVYPAAGFVREALHAGAATIEVNREVSEVSGLFAEQRQGDASATVPALVAELLAG
jgi:NAD-dependent deacetylase